MNRENFGNSANNSHMLDEYEVSCTEYWPWDDWRWQCFFSGPGNVAFFTARRPKLKEEMTYVMEHPEEMSKFAKIKAQVAEVKGVMKDNIDKVSWC